MGKGADTWPSADPSGQYQVVLESGGSNKLAVIKAIRTVTGWELGPAKNLAQAADASPQLVVRFADSGPADAAVEVLQRAGAAASVRMGSDLPAVVGGDGAASAGTFVCHFCSTIGTGEFCANCGAPHKSG